METSRSLRFTYDWALHRIRELTKDVSNQCDFRCVQDANAIREEFSLSLIHI